MQLDNVDVGMSWISTCNVRLCEMDSGSVRTIQQEPSRNLIMFPIESKKIVIIRVV